MRFDEVRSEYLGMTGKIARAISPFDVGVATWLTLRELADAGEPVTQRRLAELMGVTESSVSASIAKLRARKLVSHRRDRSDRRHRMVEISPAGLELLKQIDPVAEAAAEN